MLKILPVRTRRHAPGGWPARRPPRPGRSQRAAWRPERVAPPSDQDGAEPLPEPEPRLGAVQGDKEARLIAQLHVEQLSSEDNGLYRCRVDFRRARSRIEEAELRIIGECCC